MSFHCMSSGVSALQDSEVTIKDLRDKLASTEVRGKGVFLSPAASFCKVLRLQPVCDWRHCSKLCSSSQTVLTNSLSLEDQKHYLLLNSPPT